MSLRPFPSELAGICSPISAHATPLTILALSRARLLRADDTGKEP